MSRLAEVALLETYLGSARYLSSRPNIADCRTPKHDFYIKVSRCCVVSESILIEAWRSLSLSVFLWFYSTTLWCSALDQRQLFNAFTLVHPVNDKFASEVTVPSKGTDYLTCSLKRFRYRVLPKWKLPSKLSLSCLEELKSFCLRERDHLEDPCLNWRIILRQIFRKLDRAWTGLIWPKIGDKLRALSTAVMNLRIT